MYATRLRGAVIMLVLGAVMTLGSGVAGLVWLNRVPDLHPLPLGNQTEFTASRSATVTIYTTTGQASAPACSVAIQDGREVLVGEPKRYQQSEGLESTYGFPATSDATYTISCGSSGEIGQFAVAEVGTFPQATFVALGALGLLLCAGGGVLAWRGRRTSTMRSG